MRRLRRSTRRGGDDRGAELIELAIVLPILLLVFAAIVDFGFLFQRYEVITNAAREGARLGTLPGYSATGAGSDVELRVQDYLTAAGLDPNLATVTPTIDTAFPIGGGTDTIEVVSVLVTYPANFGVLAPIVGLVGGTPLSSINLRARSNMRLEPGGGTGS